MEPEVTEAPDAKSFLDLVMEDGLAGHTPPLNREALFG